MTLSWSKVYPLVKEERDDFGIILDAKLTLLGLLIGFSFLMAISRYDLRKNYEEAEANAIGVAESHPDSGLGIDGRYRHLL